MSAAWNGEGLPPVGAVCEFEVEVGDWRRCEVIARKDDYAVCWIHVNKILATGGHAIRPVRTPEQIAAEERNSGIDAILDAYTYTVGPCTHKLAYSQAMRLYDAGIRKVTS